MVFAPLWIVCREAMASLATVLLLLASAFAQEAQVAPVDLEADALDEAQSTDTAARTSACGGGRRGLVGYG